jgi:hypothetical protein
MSHVPCDMFPQIHSCEEAMLHGPATKESKESSDEPKTNEKKNDERDTNSAKSSEETTRALPVRSGEENSTRVTWADVVYVEQTGQKVNELLANVG